MKLSTKFKATIFHTAVTITDISNVINSAVTSGDIITTLSVDICRLYVRQLNIDVYNSL